MTPEAANGFAKLAELDFTGDQVIDASDPGFADLRVWRDDNGDGIGQALELHTLGELGIQSLGTTATPSTQVISGNPVTDLGSFTFTDGSTGTIADV